MGASIRKHSFTKILRILQKIKLVPSASSVFSSLQRFRKDPGGCIASAKRAIGDYFCCVTSDNVEKSVKNRQIGSDKPTMAKNVSNFAHILKEHEMPGGEQRRKIREKLSTLLFDELGQERRPLESVMLHELNDLNLRSIPRLETIRSEILELMKEIRGLQTKLFQRRNLEMVDPPEDTTPFEPSHFTPIEPLNVQWPPPSPRQRRSGSGPVHDELVYDGKSSFWGGIERFNEVRKRTKKQFVEYLADVNKRFFKVCLLQLRQSQ